MENLKIDFAVVVIAFNSEETIISTLESIKKQTVDKKKIHLIIADDASKDGTILVVEKWLEEYKDVFGRVTFIKSEINCGVSGNFNKGVRASREEWIKTIAADDILHEDCLRVNKNFLDVSGGEICFSPVMVFHERVGDSKEVFFKSSFFEKNAYEQNKILIKKNFVYAPSLFVSRRLLLSFGIADERFPMIEDYPLWFKLTKNGVHLKAHKTPLVYYRVNESLSLGKNRIANTKFLDSFFYFRRKVVWPELKEFSFLYKYNDVLTHFALKTAVILFKNKKSIFSNLYIYMLYLTSPVKICHFFNKYK
ncbi:glycosyltransferase [Comamonas aquatica]|uniref:glycosyltransferase family 2 protein n=1 Tax=Comamonas aquatica TaxID=225991 RepID=UPI002446A71B|nr:glycosyltransferase family 2 protein [Comamonas aquatica]MDH0900959.1 glycosyltransferase [Comamonas aquatica]